VTVTFSHGQYQLSFSRLVRRNIISADETTSLNNMKMINIVSHHKKDVR